MGNRNLTLIQFSDFGLGRGLYITHAFSSLGLDVTILTNKPVYSSNKQSQRNLDIKAKVTEVRIPFVEILHESTIGKLIVYVIFTFLSFIQLLTVKPEILYSRGPQPFTEITCLLYKKLRRKVKIISDITDLWPDALEYITLDRVIKSTLIFLGNAINEIIYSRLDMIVTHNELMAEVLRKRSQRPVYVLQGVLDLVKFRPMEKGGIILSQQILDFVKDRFVVLYAGLLGLFQNPYILTDLAEALPKEDINDVVVLVVGNGPLKDDLERKAKEAPLHNIKFVERVPHEEMVYFYNAADVCLLLYAPIDFLAIGLPKKFIEYAACGKPIICVSPPCIASSLCLTHKAGFHIESSTEAISQIIKTILKLKKDANLRNTMARNSRSMAEELFSLEHGAGILETVIKEVQG